MRFNHQKLLPICLCVIAILLVACGGGDDAAGSGQTTEDAAPTNTPFPTFEYVAPTNPPVFGESTEAADATEEADEEAVVLDARMVERGLGRYEALDCASCHGTAGEGTDEAEALTSFESSEEDFITFMRTGGEIGNDHQYSTDRLSQNGARNLYQYLRSLAQGDTSG